MIAANDTDLGFLHEMAPDQLRAVLAHAAGLLAYKVDNAHASNVLRTLRRRLSPTEEGIDDGLIVRPLQDTPDGLISREVLHAAVDAAAGAYGVTREDILSLSRTKRVARARQYAMWLLRQHTVADGLPRYSFPEIACAIGLKDHTTALHAVRSVERRMAAGEVLAA